MNITSVQENVLTATDQLLPAFDDEAAGEVQPDGSKIIGGEQIKQQIGEIVGLSDESVQEFFEKLLKEKNVLPPSPYIPVQGGNLAAAYIVGMAIGVRAAQLAELDELNDIPVLDEPV